MQAYTLASDVMIKELQYKGYATEPSDYECPDGQLATSLNLINEDEQLKPVFQPAEMAVLPDDYDVVYIHDANLFTHYIIRNSGNFYWIDETLIANAETKPVPSTVIAANLKIVHSFEDVDIYNINGIGNTLIVLTSSGMHYLLWKDNEYKYLGSHIPECSISFGLQGEMVKDKEKIWVEFNKLDKTKIWDEMNEERTKQITDQTLGRVNKFIADNATNAGKFIFPFFVRYAYRLYDGSLIMHSAPIFMPCSSDVVPECLVTDFGEESLLDYDCADLYLCAMIHQLDYAVVQQETINELKDWEDIVKSVDIFISKPIYIYDQNGKCKQFVKEPHTESYSICKHINQHKDYAGKYPVKYQYSTISMLYDKTFAPDNPLPILGRLALPKRDEDSVKKDIVDNAQFYFLKSVKISELKTERTIINIPKDYLQSLVSREVMTDDYNSHDKLMPKYSFAYNSRLNIIDIKTIAFDGFNPAAMFPYTDGYVGMENYNAISDVLRTVSVSYLIKQDGKTMVVSGGTAKFGKEEPFLWLYYPNANAYKAILRENHGTANSIYYEVKLEPHPTLNGAYCFEAWGGILENAVKLPIGQVPAVTKDNSIEVPNKIYTSEINNPFYFPVLGINTVGTGTIVAISAAAKAMSQGQFGQFPLYAFTTEGVWALEVSATGTYTARQPITRDVCINPESITQLDSAVLFATDRGIMLIRGSEAICITDTIDGESPFNVLCLPGMDWLHAKLGHCADTCLPTQPFLGFLAGCKMVYDYLHQRVFVYNPTMQDNTPNYTYAYVYSLKSKMWGMTFSNLASTINSYPEALAMTHDGKLVSFSDTDEQVCNGLFVTRPLKMEAANVHKTIYELIQRGHFERGDVATVLYGSRDLYSWHLVWSSKDHYLRGFRGTPYKYFRIAGLATLTDGKSIFGASLSFETRHTNQLR